LGKSATLRGDPGLYQFDCLTCGVNRRAKLALATYSSARFLTTSAIDWVRFCKLEWLKENVGKRSLVKEMDHRVPRASSCPDYGFGPYVELVKSLDAANQAIARMEHNVSQLVAVVGNVEGRVNKLEKDDGENGFNLNDQWHIDNRRVPMKKESMGFRRISVTSWKEETPKQENKREAGFGQAAKFLRLHTHLKPVKAKPTERILLDWLEDLTDKMDVTMLNDSDRKIVLQALLQEETCQRLWKPACASNVTFKDAVEAWLSALYPNSWFLTDLFQDLHSKKTYRGINQVVAEVVRTQRLWMEAAARKKMKFDVDVYFWKVVLVNKIPGRFHEKIQELVNGEHTSFEAFCLEVTQKLELLEEKNDRVATVSPASREMDEESEAEEADVYPMKRGRASSFGNPLLAEDSDIEEIPRATKRPPTPITRQPSPLRANNGPQRSNLPQRRTNPQRHQENIRRQKEKWAKQDAICTRCNQRGHTEDSCWVFDHRIECRRCGGMNHLAICCRSKNKGLTMTFSQPKGETHDELQQQIDKLRAQQEALKNPKTPTRGRKGRRRSE